MENSNRIAMMKSSANPASGISRTAIRSSRMEGVTPLMYSCQQTNEYDVKHILQRKPNSVHDRDRTGKTALHYCAENVTTNCIDLLLSEEASLINSTDEEGYTPLHLAVIAGNKIVIRYLLTRGADVNILDNELHSVVHWATVCGELEALDIVLDAGANPSTADIHGAYPIHYAAQMCGQKSKPTAIPVKDGRVGLTALKKLISRGVRVDVTDRDGRQPLLWAASSETPPSKVSCPSGSADAILALVNAGASVTAADKDGLTALHCAASRGHSDCLETLVALCGADVDVTDFNGCTALFYAVTLGHADCAQLLMDYGADPNIQDKKGRTAVYCGASKGQMETLKLLAHHGADLWLRNGKGDVALHEAVGSGRKDLVLWFLKQRNSASNLANNHGRCPLHVAAMNNNVEMCKILIDWEADVNSIMRSSRGQLLTPLDAALQRGNRGCAKFLQLHGGLPAAKLTDSKALQKALSQALTENHRFPASILNQNDDNPSFTDSQTSTMTSVLTNVPFTKPTLRSFSRLEDSSTQTQLDESVFSETKDTLMNIRNNEYRYNETESGLRRRRLRRRIPRRSMSDSRPPPNDEELRWKLRQQRNSDGNQSDPLYSGTDDEEDDDQLRKVVYVQPTTGRSSYVDVPFAGKVHEEIQVELLKEEPQIDEETMRQSVMSSLGAESSGNKDSGVSDVLGTLVSEHEDNFSDVIRSKEVHVEQQRMSHVTNESNNHSPLTRLAHSVEDHSTISHREGFRVPEEVENNSPLEILDRYHSNTVIQVHSLKNSIDIEKCDEIVAHQSPPTTTTLPAVTNPQCSSHQQDKRLTKGRSEENITPVKSRIPVSERRDFLAIRETGIHSSTRFLPSSRSFRKATEKNEDNYKKSLSIRRSKSERVSASDYDKGDPLKSNVSSSISVTRAAQLRTRRYNLERKIFQQLLDLKQLQIRSGQANEQVFAKRLIESFKKDAVTVGLRPYDGCYSFKELENYLYNQLRIVQGGGYFRSLPAVDSSKTEGADPEHPERTFHVKQLATTEKNPSSQCTHSTCRCPHAMHAYTGIPCAAYIPYQRHHLKSKTEGNRTTLPKIHPSNGAAAPTINENIR